MAGFILGPDPLVLDGNLLKNYEIFENQFNKFYDSKEYLHDLPESEKIAFFLTTIGKNAREIYETFDLSPDDSSITLKTVMDRFRLYCESHKDNSVYHSYKFYSRNQREDETFESYLKDTLHLAKPCHFNYDRETIERLIRDKIIFGLSNPTIRENIFIEGYSKLDEIVNYCLARDKNEPDASKEMIPENNLVIKTEKMDEEEGNDNKEKEPENKTDKNFGNTVTSSNDVLSTPAKPVSDCNGIKCENSDDSVLEKGEVSTSGCGFFVNVVEEQNENNSASTCESKLQNVNVNQEISGLGTSDTGNDRIDVSGSGSCPNKAGKVEGNKMVENKKSLSEDSNKVYDVITIDSSDDEEPGKNRFESIKKTLNFVNVKHFKCGKCGAELYKKGELYKHVKYCTAHLNNENMNIFKCPVCAKVFYKKGSLAAHVVIHRSAKLYNCDICDKVFDRGSKLSAHKAVTHGIRRDPFNCPKCSKAFGDTITLKEHLKEHRVIKRKLGNSSASVKNGFFKCALCRKHFKDYESLANHKHY